MHKLTYLYVTQTVFKWFYHNLHCFSTRRHNVSQYKTNFFLFRMIVRLKWYHSTVDGLSVGHLMVLRVRNKRVIVSLDVLIWASTKLVNPSPKVRILCCLNDFNYKKEKNVFNRYKWKMHKTAQIYFKGLLYECMYGSV